MYTCLVVNPVEISGYVRKDVREVPWTAIYPGGYSNDVIPPCGWISVVDATAYNN